MPVVLALARTSNLKASRLLIPLSFAAIAGGTCTLIGTSTNILIDGIAQEHGMAPFRMFEIGKLGLIYATVVTGYLLTAGRKLLPHRQTLATLIAGGETREFLTQAVISKGSPLLGKTLPQTPLAKLPDLRLVEVRRHGERLMTPLTELEFLAGDQLLMTSAIAGVHGMKATAGIEFRGKEEFGLADVETRLAILMEGIIGRRSLLIGRTLRELEFRQRYGVVILAVHRGRNESAREFRKRAPRVWRYAAGGRSC